jgi:hypothetical protein
MPTWRSTSRVVLEGENRYLLKWSVEEAGRAFVDAGLITWPQLDRTLEEMQEAIEIRE